MITCKFGDEEDFEEVSCTYDNDSEQILCRRPLRSRKKDKNNELISAKMTVSLTEDDSSNNSEVVSPVLIVQDGTVNGGTIELKQFKPITTDSNIINDEILYTRLVQDWHHSSTTVHHSLLFQRILRKLSKIN